MTDNEKLDRILSEIQGMKTDVQELKTDVQVLKAEMQGMKIDMHMHRRETAEMKAETEIYRAGVEAKFQRLMLHLENVTDRNIRIIAEGHADLNRKLDEALKIENEKEVFKVRLNYLEGEMAEVKEWISRFEKTA